MLRLAYVWTLHLFGHLGGAGAQLPGVSDVLQHKGERAKGTRTGAETHCGSATSRHGVCVRGRRPTPDAPHWRHNATSSAALSVSAPDSPSAAEDPSEPWAEPPGDAPAASQPPQIDAPPRADAPDAFSRHTPPPLPQCPGAAVLALPLLHAVAEPLTQPPRSCHEGVDAHELAQALAMQLRDARAAVAAATTAAAARATEGAGSASPTSTAAGDRLAGLATAAEEEEEQQPQGPALAVAEEGAAAQSEGGMEGALDEREEREEEEDYGHAVEAWEEWKREHGVEGPAAWSLLVGPAEPLEGGEDRGEAASAAARARWEAWEREARERAALQHREPVAAGSGAVGAVVEGGGAAPEQQVGDVVGVDVAAGVQQMALPVVGVEVEAAVGDGLEGEVGSGGAAAVEGAVEVAPWLYRLTWAAAAAVVAACVWVVGAVLRVLSRAEAGGAEAEAEEGAEWATPHRTPARRRPWRPYGEDEGLAHGEGGRRGLLRRCLDACVAACGGAAPRGGGLGAAGATPAVPRWRLSCGEQLQDQEEEREREEEDAEGALGAARRLLGLSPAQPATGYDDMRVLRLRAGPTPPPAVFPGACRRRRRRRHPRAALPVRARLASTEWVTSRCCCS